MGSPFEVTLASLNGVAAECDAALQRAFHRAQRDAELLAADVLRSAHVVIADVNTSLLRISSAPTRSRARRRRAPRRGVVKRSRRLQRSRPACGKSLLHNHPVPTPPQSLPSSARQPPREHPESGARSSSTTEPCEIADPHLDTARLVPEHAISQPPHSPEPLLHSHPPDSSEQCFPVTVNPTVDDCHQLQLSKHSSDRFCEQRQQHGQEKKDKKEERDIGSELPTPPVPKHQENNEPASIPESIRSPSGASSLRTVHASPADGQNIAEISQEEQPESCVVEKQDEVSQARCDAHSPDMNSDTRYGSEPQHCDETSNAPSHCREKGLSDHENQSREKQTSLKDIKSSLQDVCDGVDARSPKCAHDSERPYHELHYQEKLERQEVIAVERDLESSQDTKGNNMHEERVEPIPDKFALFPKATDDKTELEDKSSSPTNSVLEHSVPERLQSREHEKDESSPSCRRENSPEPKQPKTIGPSDTKIGTKGEDISQDPVSSFTTSRARETSTAIPSRENDSKSSHSLSSHQQLPASQEQSKPSRIVVDNAGKIDHNARGLLSKIIGTTGGDETELQVNKPSQKFMTPRTTKLFNPNNNIYSVPQTGADGSVQRFSSSNRSSILSRTPGAEAPYKKSSPGLSRQEKLASLNKQFKSIQVSVAPELQVAELRNARTGTYNHGDFKSKEIHLEKDGDNTFRSVRERTLKLAETHVKDNSRIDLWSMRSDHAKTSPRNRLRAREHSKSKSAFRSKLEEIMSGKAICEKENGDTTNACALATSRTLDDITNDAVEVGARISNHTEEKLLKTYTHDPVRSTASPDGNSSIVLQNSQQSPVEENILHGASEVGSISGGRKRSSLELHSTAISRIERDQETPTARGDSVSIQNVEKASASNAPLTNLMTSIVSFFPGTSSLLGARPAREESEETEAEISAKRQKLDMERREAEIQARREAQRLLKQKETEEKQRRAEKRRLMLARAEKEKEEERRRKEERRLKKKLEEEELRRRRKQEDDRKKEERRRLVLEKKAQNEMKLKRKKKVNEPVLARKVPKGISGKAWLAGQGPAHSPDADIFGYENANLSGTPSTPPVTKKADVSHGQSNYDMTPAQETIFELSDEEEERRKHKQIPQWAQGPKLSTAAKAQPDPDDVFVNVPTCDLREVFGNVRRFRARTSSANWTRDRVTAQEMVKFRKGQATFHDSTK